MDCSIILPETFSGGIGEGQHALGGVLMNEESISGKGFFPLSSFVGERRRRSWLFFLPAGNCLRLEDVSIWTHSLLNRPTQVGRGGDLWGESGVVAKKGLSRGASISPIPARRSAQPPAEGETEIDMFINPATLFPRSLYCFSFPLALG